jgi:MFS superfamily sulfate permease-like transporter
MWNLGLNSFIAFTTTVVLTLAEDLLVGIFAGIIVKAILSLISGAKLKDLFSPNVKISEQGPEAILSFEGSLTFFSALKQRKIFQDSSRYSQMKIDLTRITYIDATSLSLIARETAKLEKSGVLVIISLNEKYDGIYNHLKGH